MANTRTDRHAKEKSNEEPRPPTHARRTEATTKEHAPTCPPHERERNPSAKSSKIQRGESIRQIPKRSFTWETQSGIEAPRTEMAEPKCNSLLEGIMLESIFSKPPTFPRAKPRKRRTPQQNHKSNPVCSRP
jgi:hypothetical protein